MADGEFSVVQFFPDGTWERVAEWVDGRTAVETAKSYTERPAALIGIIARIVITDGGDFTVFEWRFGEGVVYPTREMRAARAQEDSRHE